jgi:hypothetical protein
LIGDEEEMNVLVATKETQGARKNDFNWCNEGELVRFAFECDGETVDGHCGCKRSMAGIDSQKATTTMKVVDMNITRQKLIELIRKSQERAGWGIEVQEMAEEDVNELTRIANFFKAGDVLERRGNKFGHRVIKK